MAERVMHPARQLTWNELTAGLDEAVRQGRVYSVMRGSLRLFHYSSRCVYEQLWEPFAEMARGLIIDVAREELIATPFPKFFNYGERSLTLPDLPFEAFEKLDGSLGIAFHHDGQWQVTTKGSFGADQANWATERLRTRDLQHLVSGTTYLFEIVYKANRIVVDYAYEDLVLLGAYDGGGRELEHDELSAIATNVGVRLATRYAYDGIASVMQASETLDKNAEGFVVRFSNGYRAKIKGSAYRRIHQLVSRVTPLGLWDAILAGDDLEVMRREIPEEYWRDYDTIARLLSAACDAVVAEVATEAEKWSAKTDKELGLALQSGALPEPARSYIFAYRKNASSFPEPKVRAAILRSLRRTNNVLQGYRPSTQLTGFRDADV